MSRISRIRPEILVSLFLIAITVAVFGQVLGHAFVRYDDDVYVTLNQAVQSGLNRATITWAFVTRYNANWHPLTWISLMADRTFLGAEPWGFHLTNLLLHIANVLLLFLILRRITGSVWRSGFVAALFAIHPLHVESVAWVAERKDVLSGLFWMLTVGAYVFYAERPTTLRWAAVGAFFVLGLMAKPMLVTLPFVLLLLDYWPLRRVKPSGAKSEDRGYSFAELVTEKFPLFAIAFVSCVITFKAQQAGGSLSPSEVFPLPVRIWNAMVSYAVYLQMTILPRGLAVFYPHPEKSIAVWQIIVSGLVLLSITVLALKWRRSKPYLLVGWLWYLVTLLPVIGLVQVGVQARADRYMYIPLIGLSVAVAWLVPELLRPVSPSPRLLVASAGAVTLALAACAWVQTGYWRDSVTLFTRATQVTRNNALAYANLGLSLTDEERYEEAIAAYRESLRINMPSPKVHYNLAVALSCSGDYAEAWKEIHLTEKYGAKPPEGFIQDLTGRMPDPFR